MSTRQYVVFTVDNEEFGLCIDNISSIERMMEIYKIPNSPDYIEGLANLRGKVITVFNLRKRFGLPCPDFDDNTRIIIANTSASQIGIIVDNVREIIKVEDSEFEPAPEVLSRVRDRFLGGTIKTGDRLIMVLDLEKVLAVEELVKA